MEIVTALCVAEQDRSLINLVHNCTGSLTLPDGNVINCAAIHGKVGFSDAIGKSCNGYFALPAQSLDPDETADTLSGMGFTVNSTDSPRLKSSELFHI